MDGRSRVDLSKEAGVAAEFIDALTPSGMHLEIHSGSELKVSDNHLELSLSANLVPATSELGDEAGVVERRFWTSSGQVRHQKLELPQLAQGQFRGRRILRKSVALYQSIGLESIQLTAVDVGRYVWAAAGFSFANEGDRRTVARSIQTLIAEAGLPLEDLDIDRVEPYDIASAVPTSTLSLGEWCDLLELEPSDDDRDYLDKPLDRPGKLLLLAEQTPPWQGKIDLRKDESNIGLRALDVYTRESYEDHDDDIDQEVLIA